MAQCSHSCNFVLIALWTLCTSICVCVITIHRSCIRRREKRDERSGHHHRSRHHHRSERHSSKKDHGVNPAAFIWFFLHLAGTIIGMVGLLDLIKNSYWYDPVVRRLSLGFGITTIITAVLTGLYMYKRHRQRLHDGYDDFCSPWVCGVLATILAFLAGFCISSTLYCDVVLGMIAGNMLGRPSSDLWKLYWPWFIANRILLLIN
ncbi:hypothetical protein BDV95DRAFT_496770 [Massariosphaeria phaeospora]|uniref:Uncharacterized protein n=1 Tax=Massariosphaeria phaeospora TaxID=100035 RepID=A0A7C8I8P4_9PLEO|nr:hypothetical protein BDV95DRAFT_496770 [Massariosphaeria phaeospora]